MPSENQAANSSRIEQMLAFLCIKDTEGLAEQVKILDRFDLPSAQIAKTCGVAEGSVRNARMQAKSPAKRKKQSIDWR